VNADPSVPFLDGAAFDLGKNDTFSDPAHQIVIRLLRKAGNSYDISVRRNP
jgi:hypothetical protein